MQKVLGHYKSAMRLSFRREGEITASLTLPVLHMRQWLCILRTLWGAADWPMGIWPEWMRETATVSSTRRDSLH